MYSYTVSPNAPATEGFAITPADADLRKHTRGLYVGTAGDLVVVLVGDESESPTPITIANAAAGYHPLACRRVCAATTAEDIVGIV